MLGATKHYTRAAMTTPGHMLWTLLTVSLSLLHVYSVTPDCPEMAVCMDELRDMNASNSVRVGTSHMIDTCVQLTQNSPVCYETAKDACQLKKSDTFPYLILYNSIKASCSEVCPIFQPLLNCETKVAYVDLSTNKNAYCRSYIESMECLDSSLINITCSFGDETRAYILDTVYDQGARQFGDGVCLKAKDCPDIDQSVTAVGSCLRHWNTTRDYSDSGTDTLKACISKMAACSDALKMVPFYEKSLIGIDVTVPVTTESTETTSVVTTSMMTSSVRSPDSSSTDTSVRTSSANLPDVVNPTTEIVRLNTSVRTSSATRPDVVDLTTEIVRLDTSVRTSSATRPDVVDLTTEIVRLDTSVRTSSATRPDVVDLTTEIVRLDTSVRTSSTTRPDVVDLTTEIVRLDTSVRTSSSTRPDVVDLTTEIVRLDTSVRTSTATWSDVVDLTTEIAGKPLDPTDTTEDISMLPTTEPITKPYSHRTSISFRNRVRGLITDTVTSRDDSKVTVEMSKGIRTDPLTTTDYIIPNDSTTSSRKPAIYITKRSSTTSGNDDDVAMETGSHSGAEYTGISTVLSLRRPFSTDDDIGTTQDDFTTTSFSPIDADVLKMTTRGPFIPRSIKSDPYTVSISAGFTDRPEYPRTIHPRVNAEVDEEDDTALQITPEPITFTIKTSAAVPTTTGRQITRTQSDGSQAPSSSSTESSSKMESVTEMSSVKLTLPSSSVTPMTSTSPELEDKSTSHSTVTKGSLSGDTNGGSTVLLPRPTSVWTLVTLLAYLLT